MSYEALISITGIATGVAGICFVLRASRQSVQTAEPDPERVKHFVETAPLDRLQNIKAS